MRHTVSTLRPFAPIGARSAARKREADLLRRLLAAAALGALPALASAEAPADCPANASELPVAALYGSWQARIEGQPGVAVLRLQPHPEYAGSVRGSVERTGVVAQVAGDIDDEGVLALDESLDGRAISAVWTGELRPGSCGKEFQGTWRNTRDDSTHPFTLERSGSWQ